MLSLATEVQLLTKAGDALQATDQVQEFNSIGFNKPDWSAWNYARGNVFEMRRILSKYRKTQLPAMIPADVIAQIDWSAVEPKTDEDHAHARQAEAGAEAHRREALKKLREAFMTPVRSGDQIIFRVEGRFADFNGFRQVNQKHGIRYNGSNFIPLWALADLNFEGYRADLKAVGVTLFDLPVIAKEELALFAAHAEIERVRAAPKLDSKEVIVRHLEGVFQIFTPYSDKMNQAFRATKKVLKWNAESKCRETSELACLEEALHAIYRTHEDWKVVVDPSAEQAMVACREQLAAAEQPIPELVALMKPEYKPFAYQNVGIRFLLANDCSILNGDEMGLGKTLQGLGAVALTGYRALVMGPRSGRRNWVKEAAKFFLPEAGMTAFEITPKTKLNVDLSGYRIISINYEQAKKWAETLKALNFDLILIDESHRIKNPDAQITQLLTIISAGIPRHTLLSGTAIKNKPVELYTQMQLVDATIFPTRESLKTFYGEIHERMKPRYIARLKRDVFKDMPEKLRSVIETEEPIDADYPVFRNDQGVVTSVGTLEIGQISSLKTQIAIEKAPLTVAFVNDLLDGSDSKVIVFSDSSQAAQAIFDLLGPEIAVLHIGETSDNAREAAKDIFQDKNSAIRVFVATTGTCKETVTLTAADRVVFNDLPWTSADARQAEDRAHRIGQERVVNVYWMQAQGNIFDSIACSTVLRKMNLHMRIQNGERLTAEERKFAEDKLSPAFIAKKVAEQFGVKVSA